MTFCNNISFEGKYPRDIEVIRLANEYTESQMLADAKGAIRQFLLRNLPAAIEKEKAVRSNKSPSIEERDNIKVNPQCQG